MTDQPSGKLYSTVTKHWPRIAAGLVVVIGLLEFVVGGLTADSGIEFYLLAWAGMTGGLWFLFEKAEKALGDESRERVVSWLGASGVRSGIESVPGQFAALFDRVFGTRHLSIRCLVTSGLASVASVVIVTIIWVALRFPDEVTTLSTVTGEVARITRTIDTTGFLAEAGVLLVLATVFNLIPDYVSLLQTRFLMGWARRGTTALVLGIDLLLTAALSAGLMYAGSSLVLVVPNSPEAPPGSVELGALARLDGQVGRLVLPVVPLSVDTSYVTLASADETARAMIDFVAATQADWCQTDGGLEAGEPCMDPGDGGSYSARPIWSEAGSAALHEWSNSAEGEALFNPALQSEAERAVSDSLYRVFQDEPFDGWEIETRPPYMGSLRFSGYARLAGLPLGIFFYSAFFTSIWLWLYAASVLVSRVLLRMNSGVGFLLRVTDVEKQPFRSMGFVSVIIASGLFALGLPLVLL